MLIKKSTLWSLMIVATLGSAFIGYGFFTQSPPHQFFKTKQVQRRNIRHSVHASGSLDVKQLFKIGSLIAGTVESVEIAENQYVKKGDLLARINNGKGDTDLQATRHQYIKATEEYNYQKNLFARQKALFQAGQLSLDAYEFREKELKKAQADMNSTHQVFKKSCIDYDNRNITAPDNGIITAVYASKGMSVLNDYLNTLFELALDITDLEATLDIDECDIGHIAINQKVHLTVSTYPDQIFKGLITNVSLTPKMNNGFLSGKQPQEGPPYYKAKVSLKNNDNLLRPGMGVNAKINIEKSKNALSISGLAFQVNPKLIAKLSKMYGYHCQAIDEQEKKDLCKTRKHERIKFIWVSQKMSLVEKAISVGVTDDTWWEVKGGLTDQEHIVIDVQEPENMESRYAHLFRKL